MVLSSCKTSDPKAPKMPTPDLKQVLVNVQVCKDGVCTFLNACKVWHLTEENKWVLLETKELTYCSGIFGITSKELVDFKNYAREMDSWIGNNCGLRVNGQPKTADQQ